MPKRCRAVVAGAADRGRASDGASRAQYPCRGAGSWASQPRGDDPPLVCRCWHASAWQPVGAALPGRPGRTAAARGSDGVLVCGCWGTCAPIRRSRNSSRREPGWPGDATPAWLQEEQPRGHWSAGTGTPTSGAEHGVRPPRRRLNWPTRVGPRRCWRPGLPLRSKSGGSRPPDVATIRPQAPASSGRPNGGRVGRRRRRVAASRYSVRTTRRKLGAGTVGHRRLALAQHGRRSPGRMR
jgi:hypothetical protein